MNKKTKVLATSIATIAMTASLAVGGTYALFTSEDKVNISVSSGTVKVNANVNEGSVVMTSIDQDVTESKTFANGGTAVWSENTVTLDKITPGDKISFNIDITNESNVNVLYRTVVSCVDGIELFAGLKVSLDYASDTAEAQVFDGMTAYGAWTALAGVETATAVDTVAVTVEFPYLTTSQNEYQGLSTEIEFSVEAVQGNADVSDDTAAEGETLVYTANDLKLVSLKAANGYTFKDETVKLASDIDLGASASTFAMRATPVANWTPIGTETNPFQGTFDGNGFKVSNMVAIGDTCVGLFGKLATSNSIPAVIKNVTVENAYVSATSYAGAIVGMGYTGRIENCHVKGLIQVSGNYMVGGINGHGYAKIDNCSVAGTSGSYVTGTFLEADLEGDNVGGIVGHMAEGNTVSNCSVSGIAVSGTRKVGGAVGIANGGSAITDAKVENVTVESNADEDYVANNASKIFVGGILGEYNGNVTVSGGSISNSSVKGLEDKTGVVAGGSRAADAVLTSSVKIGDQVTVNNGTYAYNEDNMMLYTEGEEVVLYSIADYTHTGDTFTVPEGVTYVNASMGSLNVKKVVFANTVKKVGRVFDENATLEEVVLNEGLEVIGNRAFRRCHNLTTVNIPSTVTTIESGAFMECHALKEAIIPEGVTEIGEWAFGDCFALETFVMPEGLITIGPSVLRGTQVKEITIPSTVTSIGSMAFRDNYQLTTIHVQCATVPTVGASAFLRAASPMYMRTYYIYNAEVYNAWNGNLPGGEKAKWATYVNKDAMTAEELHTALANNEDVTLTSDIDMTNVAWTQIAAYGGTFDGNGYTIKNYSSDNAMFKLLQGATIKNLKFENAVVTNTQTNPTMQWVAILAAATDKATNKLNVIDNVQVLSGSVTAANNSYYVGAIVGADRAYESEIKNCVNYANVTGGSSVGGIIGYTTRGAVIDNCVNYGTITGGLLVGGIVGFVALDESHAITATISNCKNYGSVSSDTQTVQFVGSHGGIVGNVGRSSGDTPTKDMSVSISSCSVLQGQNVVGTKANYMTPSTSYIIVVEENNTANLTA